VSYKGKQQRSRCTPARCQQTTQSSNDQGTAYVTCDVTLGTYSRISCRQRTFPRRTAAMSVVSPSPWISTRQPKPKPGLQNVINVDIGKCRTTTTVRLLVDLKSSRTITVAYAPERIDRLQHPAALGPSPLSHTQQPTSRLFCRSKQCSQYSSFRRVHIFVATILGTVATIEPSNSTNRNNPDQKPLDKQNAITAPHYKAALKILNNTLSR